MAVQVRPHLRFELPAFALPCYGKWRVVGISHRAEGKRARIVNGYIDVIIEEVPENAFARTRDAAHVTARQGGRRRARCACADIVVATDARVHDGRARMVMRVHVTLWTTAVVLCA